MDQTSYRLHEDHLGRFYETAYMVRSGLQSECPILEKFRYAEYDLLPYPQVRWVWDETENPSKTLWACYEASRLEPRAEVFDKIIKSTCPEDIPQVPERFQKFDTQQNGRSLWSVWNMARYTKFINSHRLARVLMQWDHAKPMGACHDRAWFGVQWPRSRYGLGWLCGDHTGDLCSPGNTNTARMLAQEVCELAYTGDYEQWHVDGYQWSPNSVALYAETFGAHSLRVMLKEDADK